jgi:hypothetical protein
VTRCPSSGLCPHRPRLDLNTLIAILARYGPLLLLVGPFLSLKSLSPLHDSDMSGRVPKPGRSARLRIRDSTAVRKLLAEKIESECLAMPSCTNCRLAGRSSCVASPNPSHTKCASCTRTGVPCDVKEFDSIACMFSVTAAFSLFSNGCSIEDSQRT